MNKWYRVFVVIGACALVACSDSSDPQPDCGNGAIDSGEECDGDNLGAATCVGAGFAGGTLSCDSACLLDTSSCTDPPVCGDEQATDDEICDGADLDGMSCATIGLGGGTLACSGTCDSFDVSGCTSQPVCGDDEATGNEICDGNDLDGESCSGLGFDGGTLDCNATCDGYDTSGCTSANTCTPADTGFQRCAGDTIEQCDGSSYVLATDCSAAGEVCYLVSPGVAQCQLPTTCTPAESGFQRCNGDLIEQCDGSNYVLATDCSAVGEVCYLDSPGVAQCQVPTTCTPAENGSQRCNGDLIEQCDGSNWLSSQDCSVVGDVCYMDSPGVAVCVLTGICTPAENGSQRCNGNIVELCDGSNWLSSQDCAMAGAACTSPAPGVAYCN